MTTLRDYARDVGVSYEAVRQQVKRYKKDLEGHIHQDGRTQFLDDYAITFLNKKRARNPVVIYDKGRDERLAELEAENKDLLERLAAAQEVTLRTQQALLEAKGAQARLEAAEKETKILEGFIQDAKTEIAALTDERAQEAARAAEAAKRAELAEAELAAYKALPWYKKLRRERG